MEKVTMKLNRMGIPVPEIARGVNPHETIRESMLTLEGPVVTDDVALAGNHRLVILNPVGGAPAFYPLAGHATDPEETGADGLIAFLDSVCPGHTYTNNPAAEIPAHPEEAEAAQQNVQTTWCGSQTEGWSLSIYPDRDNPSGDTITVNAANAATEAKDAWYMRSSSDPEDPWVLFSATYDSGTMIVAKKVIAAVPATDNAEASLTERFNWLFDRLFIVRAGSEFAEMPIVDPVMYEEYEGLDAANDTCVRLHKGIISNLAVLGLTNDPNLATYVYNVKPGECAAIFVSEDGTEVELAPASFGHTPTDLSDTYIGPFSGWTKIALPSVVVNKAEVKTRVTEKSSETYVCIDITCC